MKLSIQGTPIDTSDMPYLKQLKSLLEAGPVGKVKSVNPASPPMEDAITFFGHANADYYFLFNITDVKIDCTDDLREDDDCECEYCTREWDSSTKSWKCDQEEEVFVSANIAEIMRVSGTGQSFTDIVKRFDLKLQAQECGLDFIVGMKSEFPSNVISMPLTDCLLENDPDVRPPNTKDCILANSVLLAEYTWDEIIAGPAKS